MSPSAHDPDDPQRHLPVAVAASIAEDGVDRADAGILAGIDRATALTLAALCLLALPFVVVSFLPPINHDVAALLHFADRWVSGERLYVELIDMNPPLIFILSAVPVLLDRLLPIDAPIAMTLCVYALGAWSARLCWQVVRPELSARDLHGLMLLPLLVLVVGPFAGFSFGQREHLMAIAALPYLYHAEARLAGRVWLPGVSAPVAVLAALGFCLKPHFLVIPLLVEGWLLARRGFAATLRDRTLHAMLAVGLLYAAVVVLLFPAYLAAVVPLARANYARLGHATWLDLVFVQPVFPMVAVAVALAAVAFRRAASPRSRLLALAMIGGLLVGLSQRKGWNYHFVPFESFTLLLAASLLAEWGERVLPPQEMRRTGPALAMIAALFGAAYLHTYDTRESIWRQSNYWQETAGRLASVLKQEAANAPVMVLSPAIYPVYPAVNYAHARLAMRFMTLWVVQGAYANCLPDGRLYRDTWEMSEEEFFAYRAVAEDFARAQPPVLVVDKDTGIGSCGADFSFIDYFRRHPLFAETFRHYEQKTSVGTFDIYLRR